MQKYEDWDNKFEKYIVEKCIKNRKIDWLIDWLIHLEEYVWLRYIFFNCFRIIFSLASFTVVFGSFMLFPSDLSEPSVDLLSSILSFPPTLDVLISFFLSVCKPMASATSLTGRLKAARYYFLDSTCWEWNLFIS